MVQIRWLRSALSYSKIVEDVLVYPNGLLTMTKTKKWDYNLKYIVW